MSVLSELRGLFVCEQVIVEAGTNNVSLINCFTRRHVEKFPSSPVRFAVYAALTGGIESVMMTVIVSRLVDNRTVY